MQPEARISTAIRKKIKERGGFAFKVWGSEHMMAGLPDLIVCYRGLFLGIEVKTATGVVSARQVYVHTLIRNAGGVVMVARTVSEVSALLDRIDDTTHEQWAVIRGLVDTHESGPEAAS